MSVKRKDTPDSRAFWAFVERTAREVAEECRRSGWKEDPVVAEQRGGPGGYEYPESRWTQ